MQGFLTAVKQEVSRRHAQDKWALDDVVMTAEVLHPAKEVDQLREAPQEGVYIYGLYLDGCGWSTKEGKLVDSEPKRLYHLLPVMLVTGVLVAISSWQLLVVLGTKSNLKAGTVPFLQMSESTATLHATHITLVSHEGGKTVPKVVGKSSAAC